MDNVTARLLDPKTFEAALSEILITRGQDDLCAAIRELHARLATAKAEGAAEGIEELVFSGDFGPAVNINLALRAAAIRKGIAQPPAPEGEKGGVA